MIFGGGLLFMIFAKTGLDPQYNKEFFDNWEKEWKNDSRFKDFIK